MGIYSKKRCQHEIQYDASSRVLFMTAVTNCVRCYLRLFSQLSKADNIQIHQMKVFDKVQWRREGKRIQRTRKCFDINPACEKLGIDCDFQRARHKMKLAKEIPINLDPAKKMIRFSSFACFPKYRGQGEAQYKKEIRHRKKNIDKSIMKTEKYLSWDGFCYSCGLEFDNQVKLKEHEEQHIIDELMGGDLEL